MDIRGGAALPTYGNNRQFVRLGLRDERGTFGIGEASPLPPISSDVASILATKLGEALPELTFIDEEEPPRHAVARTMKPVEGALASDPEARFALETALFDAIAVRRELSVAECLCSLTFAEIPCNGLLDASVPGLAERARRLVASRNLLALKVKLRARDNAAFERELAELYALREVFPPPFELRLDPNGAWTLSEAHEKLERLAPLAPRYVEQPVPAELLPDLGQTAVPWAADESLRLPGLPERLAHEDGCFAFVLKPAALGGLSIAFALAEMAFSVGKEVVVTHYADGPVGLAAAAELARALPKAPLACGLEPHEGLANYPDLPLPQHRKPGFVTRAALPGLGFSEQEKRRWMQMA